MTNTLKGMTETELLNLCDEKKVKKGLAPWLYWPSEMYSFGKYIREYAFFPKWLPLNIYSDHSGPSLASDIPAKHELENNAPVFFAHSSKKAQIYTELTNKRGYVLYSPAVYYRRKNDIVQNKDALGTIAFPVHSLPTGDEIFNIDKYVQQLKCLPVQYQPVSACLHMHDIAKNRHLDFMKHGIPVVTAGNPADYRFIERLYSLIRRSSYVTSNHPGTITFFSIEMGVPFFLYGETQVDVNISDPNVPRGIITGEGNSLYVKLNEALQFSKFDGKISESIQSLIEDSLGLNDATGRLKMSWILWLSLITLLSPKQIWKKVLRKQ